MPQQSGPIGSSGTRARRPRIRTGRMLQVETRRERDAGGDGTARLRLRMERVQGVLCRSDGLHSDATPRRRRIASLRFRGGGAATHGRAQHGPARDGRRAVAECHGLVGIGWIRESLSEAVGQSAKEGLWGRKLDGSGPEQWVRRCGRGSEPSPKADDRKGPSEPERTSTKQHPQFSILLPRLSHTTQPTPPHPT